MSSVRDKTSHHANVSRQTASNVLRADHVEDTSSRCSLSLFLRDLLPRHHVNVNVWRKLVSGTPGRGCLYPPVSISLKYKCVCVWVCVCVRDRVCVFTWCVRMSGHNHIAIQLTGILTSGD